MFNFICCPNGVFVYSYVHFSVSPIHLRTSHTEGLKNMSVPTVKTEERSEQTSQESKNYVNLSSFSWKSALVSPYILTLFGDGLADSIT